MYGIFLLFFGQSDTTGMAEEASPSPVFSGQNCPVFLCFRRQDTRHTFVATLYDALRRKGINAVLGGNTNNSPSSARISIIVFSKNYAFSTRCLTQLSKILNCMKQKNQIIFPIFYGVEPSDVRHQRNSYREAMTAHENRFGRDSSKVRKWRSALNEAAGLSGWHLQPGCEHEFIERVVEEVSAKLPPKRMHIGERIVGLDHCIEQVKSILDVVTNNDVCMLGIHGAGGVGKTTLTKALYNSILHHFEGASFVFNVKEASKRHRGLVRLQQTLLSDVLEEKKIKLASVDEGISKIKHRLCHKRVLLVLDDVDDIKQLEMLAGGSDWFGSGSRIIVTTRDKRLLVAYHVERTYQMKGLNDRDSLELFCWYAFNMSQPATGYEDMSDRVVSYAQGLPLVLKVIGSRLIHRSLRAWKCALEQYERIPERERFETFLK